MNKAGPAEPRQWHFDLPFIPPGVNHMYAPIGEQGKKALTREAKALRQSITLLARRAGFEPALTTSYAVRVVFTMPGWSQDIDGPLKSLLDATFTAPGKKTAWDHRIVLLEVEKRVMRGTALTEVTISEVLERQQPTPADELAAALEQPGARMVRVRRETR